MTKVREGIINWSGEGTSPSNNISSGLSRGIISFFKNKFPKGLGVEKSTEVTQKYWI